MSAALPPVLFVGTGIMGAPMARNIAAAGFAITAWNRDRSKLASLAKDRIAVCDDLTQLAPAPRVVVMMVSTGAVVDNLMFGAADLAGKLAPGSIVVVMSSIPVETAKDQAQRLGTLGIGYVDAPVSGGERGAIAGSLSIMAGGTEESIARLRPLLSAMGTLHHIGPVGTGQLAKLANQTVVGITIGAVAEAFLLARSGGADLAAVRDALLGGFARSTILDQHGERMIGQNFAPGAHAHVQLKDVCTALELAAKAGVSTPLLAKTTELYAAMCEDPDLRELDHSALYRFLGG